MILTKNNHMKTPSFLITAWHAVSGLFKKSDKEVEDAIAISVHAVQWLKTATESEWADVAVKVIPGIWDDKLLETVRAVLPTVLKELNLILADYQAVSGDVKSAYTGSIATNLGRELTAFTVPYDDVKMMVASYYKNEVKGAELVK